MSQRRPLGLIGAGNAASSPLARLPEFRKRLGPVKSSSMRVASRLVNNLGAGLAVDEFEALDGCEAIFLIVPDAQSAEAVSELAASPIAWRGKMAILSDSWRGSGILERLAALGAETASVCLMDLSADSRFLIEGSRPAMTELKRIFRRDARSFTITTDSKPLVQAALTLSESLLFPLLSAADECLKLAGIPHLQAGALLEAAALRASRAYAKSGRKGWSGPLASRDAYIMGRQIEMMALRDPLLARFFVDQCASALAHFGRDFAWLSGGVIGCEAEDAHSAPVRQK